MRVTRALLRLERCAVKQHAEAPDACVVVRVPEQIVLLSMPPAAPQRAASQGEVRLPRVLERRNDMAQRHQTRGSAAAPTAGGSAADDKAPEAEGPKTIDRKVGPEPEGAEAAGTAPEPATGGEVEDPALPAQRRVHVGTTTQADDRGTGWGAQRCTPRREAGCTNRWVTSVTDVDAPGSCRPARAIDSAGRVIAVTELPT